MSACFADTFFYLALLGRHDEAHVLAVSQAREMQQQSRRIVTTAWILTEVADALARSSRRALFGDFYHSLRASRHTTIVPASADLFDRGVRLYAERQDKHWSLTDCISFVVMREYNLTDALSGDRHFEQAGFQALLR